MNSMSGSLARQEDFAGVFPQIQRIKALGVDIVWLMPINPIGKKNRKEPLGSFYAVSDYKAVNSSSGTSSSLRRWWILFMPRRSK